MKAFSTAILFGLILCASRVDAFELLSPTGNLLHNQWLNAELLEKRGLTYRFRGGLEGADNTLEIRGDTISWSESSQGEARKTYQAPFSKIERDELVRQLHGARFLENAGSYRDINTFDLYLETLDLGFVDEKTHPKYRIENRGDHAPRGFRELTRYLMALQARTFPEATYRKSLITIPASSVFRGLEFRFAKSQLSIETSPKFVARFVDESGTKREAVLDARFVDEMVSQINSINWEEIAGVYAPSESDSRISIRFDAGKGSRTMEVAGLKVSNAPQGYREMEKFLRGFVDERFGRK